MIWDWTTKKNLQVPNNGELSDEQIDEGKSPVRPPEYGYRESPRLRVNPAEKIGKQPLQTDFEKSPKNLPEQIEKVEIITKSDTKMQVQQADSENLPNESEDEEKDSWDADDILASLKDSLPEKTDEEDDKPFKEPASGFSVSGQKFSTATVVNVDDDSAIWEWQFSLFNLPGMDLVEANYTPLDLNTRTEMRRNFRRIRRDFLRYIAYYNQPELEEAGVEDKGIRSLKKGKAPENYDVHLKIPYEYGGKNEFANMLFIQTHPFGEDIHKFLDMQTTSQPFGCRLSKLYIPVAEGRIYIPKDSTTIGGGKGMGDKTSVQGFSAQALQQLAVKSSMDRGANI